MINKLKPNHLLPPQSEWHELSSHVFTVTLHFGMLFHTWDSQLKSPGAGKYVSTYNLCLCVEMDKIDIYNLCNHGAVYSLRLGIGGNGYFRNHNDGQRRRGARRECARLTVRHLSCGWKWHWEICTGTWMVLTPSAMEVWSPCSHLEWLWLQPAL